MAPYSIKKATGQLKIRVSNYWFQKFIFWIQMKIPDSDSSFEKLTKNWIQRGLELLIHMLPNWFSMNKSLTESKDSKIKLGNLRPRYSDNHMKKFTLQVRSKVGAPTEDLTFRHISCREWFCLTQIISFVLFWTNGQIQQWSLHKLC